jgi:hypothetical protein
MTHMGVIWIISLRNVLVFLHNRQSRGRLFFFFCIQFFKQHVNITLQHALTFAIEKNITLVRDVCSNFYYY